MDRLVNAIAAESMARENQKSGCFRIRVLDAISFEVKHWAAGMDERWM
jgi:hypothetical protein